MIKERNISSSDYEVLAREIAKDETHKSWMTPEFFTQPKTAAVVYEDEHGPIFYLRMSSCLRLHVQFCETSDKERIRKALILGTASIAKRAYDNGYMSLIFETAQKSLAWFCRRYLGFTASPDEQVLWLEQLESHPETPVNSTVCESSQNGVAT